METGINALKTFVEANQERIIVLADKHTVQDCYPLLDAELPYLTVPYGENYKNLNSCEYIWKKLTDLGANRDFILLCLGGGVICDMGAYAAACYQRGMQVALVPTSLLAMVDASVGGKNGVNFLGLKNYIGTFRKATYTFICTVFLETLPPSEMVNGYVEMLKHGLIADRAHYDRVKLHFLKPNQTLDEQVVLDSISIKSQHVNQDFKDRGVRKRLNFGHTIGHAIESHSLATTDENKSLSHGVSVALGMVVESYISTRMLSFSEESLREISLVLQGIVNKLSNPLPSFSDLLPYLVRDKKNKSGKINFSLLRTIGEADHDFEVSQDLISDGIDYLHSLK